MLTSGRSSGHARLSLKGWALRYLARREHSRAELARRLHHHLTGRSQADAHEQIAAVLNELAAAGLLSERRAADALVSARAARVGDLRLRQLMRERGFDDDDIESALAPLAGAEPERALDVWRRRFGHPARDAAGRAKQVRFLAGRGFSPDTIRQLLREVEAGS